MSLKEFDVFTATEYRKVFKKKLQSLKAQLGRDYTIQKMADFCSVHSTYLSSVMNCSAHLNEDQLYYAVRFLHLDEDEIEFITLLHAYQRSSMRERKEHLKKKLRAIQDKKIHAEKLIDKTTFVDSDDALAKELYLNPYSLITWLFLSISVYQREPNLIREFVPISEEKFKDILQRLQQVGLIKDLNGRLVRHEQNYFIPKGSLIGPAHHIIAKALATQKTASLSQEKRNSLSYAFSCDQATGQKIRALVSQLMKEIEFLVANSNDPSDVFQLSYDFLCWTDR